MSEHIEGLNRDQTALFPNTLEGYVDEDNPVRFIDAFIDSLDLISLGFKHSTPSEVGRPSYDPSDLLKLYVYGYLNQIRSSRKLERECHRNVEVMWLMKKLAPDFKTIADFRKDNVDCVKGVFREFVNLCIGLDLFGAKFMAVDGVKLKAVNSTARNLNQKTLAQRMKKIDQAVSRYIDELDESDREEDKKAKRAGFIEEKVKKLMKHKEEYAELLKALKESNCKEASLTDPDCRLMKNGGKLEPCYNAHAAVDDKNHLIVDYDVTNVAPDNNQLFPVAKSAMEVLGVQNIEATADRGFFDVEEIKKCVDCGIVPYVPHPLKYAAGPVKKTGVPTREFYADKFIYDGSSDTYVCPAGNRLVFSRWTHAHGLMMGVYKTEACFSCPFFMMKCTLNKRGRMLFRWEHEGLIEEMRTRMRLEPWKVDARKCIVEHPFGTVKRAFNQGYLLLKGLKRVAGEVGFAMLAYNIRRVLNLLGPQTLTASLS
jgi:transposase